jgi:hypothetical protein
LPIVAVAQQPPLLVIGYLYTGSPSDEEIE